MTFQQELASWWSPTHPSVAEAPKPGDRAPDTPKLQLKAGKPTVVAFLRHCGCPFAEKTFLDMRDAASAAAGRGDVDFVAVSHSSEEHTQNWLKSLPRAGSEPDNMRVVVDAGLEIYAAWGLGAASWAHVLSPFSLFQVYKMGRDQKISNRPTESGSRWTTSGTYAVDADGVVRWGGPAQRADEIPDFDEALQRLQDGGGGKAAAKL